MCPYKFSACWYWCRLKSHSLYSDNCSRLGLLFWTFSDSFPNVLSFLFWHGNNSSLIRTGRVQMDTLNRNCFQFVYRLTIKTTLTYMHWERLSGNPKAEIFLKHLQLAARKLQNKKAATYFGQQKQAWKKNSFRAGILFLTQNM